jgi:hypothetical protein
VPKGSLLSAGLPEKALQAERSAVVAKSEKINFLNMIWLFLSH